jgi:hypothetical protein
MLRQTMLALVGTVALGILCPTLAHAQNWIEYHVTGAVTEDGRDEDVLICSEGDEQFQLAARGDWYFDIEANGKGPGQHPAEFTVVAPKRHTAVHADRGRTDDRFRGDGTITIEAAGKDQFGMPLANIDFSAAKLESGPGHIISVEGKLVCGVM